MSDLASPPADSGEGLEPVAVEGLEPNVETPEEGQEPKTEPFDEEYVKDLRKQAADARSRAKKAEKELTELRDTKLSDAERLTKALEEAESRAAEAVQQRTAAERKAVSYEVAASRSLDPRWAEYLHGDTREELEARADELVKLVASQGGSPRTPSFDGGVRTTPQEVRSPEEEHNLLLLRAAGRVPER